MDPDPDREVGDISDRLKENVLINTLKDNIEPEACANKETETDSVSTGTRPESMEHLKANVDTSDRNVDTSNRNVDTSDRNEAPLESENVKLNPIEQLEQKLAAEESSLTEAQLEERHQKSKTLKAEANNSYKEAAYQDAVLRYTNALEICPLSEEKDRSVLHANRAAALMASDQNQDALADLDRALELDTSYVKALERRARLNRVLDRLDDSLNDYEKLLLLKPGNFIYTTTVKELQEQIRVRNEQLKTKMFDSLKQIGNVFLKPFGLSTENFSMVPTEGGGYNLQMKGQQ